MGGGVGCCEAGYDDAEDRGEADVLAEEAPEHRERTIAQIDAQHEDRVRGAPALRRAQAHGDGLVHRDGKPHAQPEREPGGIERCLGGGAEQPLRAGEQQCEADDAGDDGDAHQAQGRHGIHEAARGEARGDHDDGRSGVEDAGAGCAERIPEQSHVEDVEREGGAHEQNGHGARQRSRFEDAVERAPPAVQVRLLDISHALRCCSTCVALLPADAVLGCGGQLLRGALVAQREADDQGEHAARHAAEIEVLRRIGGYEEDGERRPDGHGDRLPQAVIADALAHTRCGQHVGCCGGGGSGGRREARTLQHAPEHESGSFIGCERTDAADEHGDGSCEHDDAPAAQVDGGTAGDARRCGSHREAEGADAGEPRSAAHPLQIDGGARIQPLSHKEGGQCAHQHEHEHGRPQPLAHVGALGRMRCALMRSH